MEDFQIDKTSFAQELERKLDEISELPLPEQEEEVRQFYSAQVPAEVKEAWEQALKQIARSGVLENARKPGDMAPDFPLSQTRGVHLSDILRYGPVVLVFFRGSWCDFCRIHLQALQKASGRIADLGAAIVSVSPQTPERNRMTATLENLTFQVSSDMGNVVGREYGLVFRVPDQILDMLGQFGVRLSDYNGIDTDELPIPATYIIAPSGEITHAWLQVDYTQRADPEQIIAALEQLKANAPA